MKLLQARFTNFRLLRNLTLDFSADTGKNLFVVRAANESGKTTLLHGLQWALYGDPALPMPRRDFRMHPINWDISNGTRVTISVEVDFETKGIRRSRTEGIIETVKKYRIIRSTYDTIDGVAWRPGPTNTKLFEITSAGSVPQNPPESRIEDELPERLREIFFTDGDRALGFIDTDIDMKTKRTRVQQSIRLLLGLDLIEEAQNRVKKTVSKVNASMRKLVQDKHLAMISEQVAEISERESELESQGEDAKRQSATFAERYVEVNREIEEALAKGNKEEMLEQLSTISSDIKLNNNNMKEATDAHADLLKDVSLSQELSAPMISRSISKLDTLRDQGKIPNSTIPVLEERLSSSFCICGEPLDQHDEHSKRRRQHISKLIDEARNSDFLQSIVTDLYFASLPLYASRDTGSTWSSRYESIAERRDSLQTRQNELGQRMASLEIRIAKIPDTNLQVLRDLRYSHQKQRDKFNNKSIRLELELENIQQELKNLISERDRLLRNQRRGDVIMAELEAAQDILTVLSNTHQRLTNEELTTVSNKMNSIFLKMIVADPDQGAIIQRAEITRQFDIVVYGPDERHLNPNIDLNGASRRALTLAFILALTKVSEVEAPNVIDTPLGMMAGLVKTSVLNTAIVESSQLILLLTPSEIEGCEEIIDKEAARVITLTNPAHYPQMLVNEPPDIESIIKCECNHNQECNVCQRRTELDDMNYSGE